MAADLGEVQRGPIAKDHERTHPLAIGAVGNRNGCGIGHGRVAGEDVLHLLRRDVLPSPDDDVLLPVRDGEEPLLKTPDVAGPEPAAVEERICIELRVEVAGEEVRTARDDLTVVPWRDVLKVVIHEADLDPVDQTPVGPDPGRRRVGGAAAGDRRVLGGTVGTIGEDAGGNGPFDQARGHARRAHPELPQAGDVGPVPLGRRQQPVEEKRCAAGDRDGVLGDEAGSRIRVPGVHDHDLGTDEREPRLGDEAADVTGRERGEEGVLDLFAGIVRCALHLAPERVVRVLDTLRIGGGARCVDHDADVVRADVRRDERSPHP